MPAQPSPPVTVVVLAAGEGTRMRSADLPKVLHGFAGRSMLAHVLAATATLHPHGTVVVVGHRREKVIDHLNRIDGSVVTVDQVERNGTGHAVRLALAAVPPAVGGTVVVVPGDAPLLTGDSLGALVAEHTGSGAAATLLTSVMGDPTGYGRVLRDGTGTVRRVVEHKDATDQELAVAEVATSVYAFDHALLREAVTRLSTDNVQGEEYLPDVISILAADGHRIGAVITPSDQTAGVNDRVQLAAAHRIYNARLIEAHMRAGVTVIDPATTWVDATVRCEPDVTLRPGVELLGATHVAAGAIIGPECTLTDTIVGAGSVLTRTVALQAEIGAGVTVGPFAYLRPGTVLGDEVHIGTYVEVKNAGIGTGTKVPHLSYVGDADIGEHTNIGAATVFVNYDGIAKHRSTIGDHARTGADNMFVAPVHVGDGAYTAAGSTITADVPPGAMAVARAPQRNVPGWVARKRSGTAAADAAERALSATTADPPVRTEPGTGPNPEDEELR